MKFVKLTASNTFEVAVVLKPLLPYVKEFELETFEEEGTFYSTLYYTLKPKSVKLEDMSETKPSSKSKHRLVYKIARGSLLTIELGNDLYVDTFSFDISDSADVKVFLDKLFKDTDVEPKVKRILLAGQRALKEAELEENDRKNEAIQDYDYSDEEVTLKTTSRLKVTTALTTKQFATQVGTICMLTNVIPTAIHKGLVEADVFVAVYPVNKLDKFIKVLKKICLGGLIENGEGPVIATYELPSLQRLVVQYPTAEGENGTEVITNDVFYVTVE